jgi:hypothetical protein
MKRGNHSTKMRLHAKITSFVNRYFRLSVRRRGHRFNACPCRKSYPLGLELRIER